MGQDPLFSFHFSLFLSGTNVDVKEGNQSGLPLMSLINSMSMPLPPRLQAKKSHNFTPTYPAKRAASPFRFGHHVAQKAILLCLIYLTLGQIVTSNIEVRKPYVGSIHPLTPPPTPSLEGLRVVSWGFL